MDFLLGQNSRNLEEIDVLYFQKLFFFPCDSLFKQILKEIVCKSLSKKKDKNALSFLY